MSRYELASFPDRCVDCHTRLASGSSSDLSSDRHSNDDVPVSGETLHLEVATRLARLPLVHTGLQLSTDIYYAVKESNGVTRWTLGRAEGGLGAAARVLGASPLRGPLVQLDNVLCAGLDTLERRLPCVKLPPRTMVSATRHYVVQRAGSVTQLGTAVLDSRVTTVTAGALDRAFHTADRYLDRYLPDHTDATDGPGEEADADAAETEEAATGRARAAQAVQHGARLRRKLQRRLTRQAIAEAHAIKEQIHVLAYVAELVATDPALAWRKARELYDALSGPEPENQARPDTLEQLLVLLAREAARKLVHLLNYTHQDLPKNVKGGLAVVTSHLAATADSLIKSVHLEAAGAAALHELKVLRARLMALLQDLRQNSNSYLEQLAVFLAGNEEREKLARNSGACILSAAALNGAN